MYAQGRGVEKDSLLAVNLYIRSAKNGYSESLDNLSLIVDLEINTAKREREAAEARDGSALAAALRHNKTHRFKISKRISDTWREGELWLARMHTHAVRSLT